MASGRDLKKAMMDSGQSLSVSSEMEQAIAFWTQLYKGEAPWISREVKSLGIPAAIATELARMVTIEVKCEITGSPRADFLYRQFIPIIDRIRRQTEYACAMGGLVFKPYLSGDKIEVNFIQADRFFPTSFDAAGRITGAVFVDQFSMDSKTYTRLECHELVPEGCKITNMAFESRSKGDGLGRQVELKTIPEWADVQPLAIITGVDRPMFGYLKMPFGNNIDLQSPLGVSVYARATDLIEEADKQYSRLLWEFESGERAVFVSDTAFKKDERGRLMLPHKRLYRALAGDDSNLFHDWTPSIREQSILNGLNSILIRIEDICGLARGTIADPNVEARTATELKILKQRSYATVTDTQKALRVALEDLIYAMDVWATLGNLVSAGEFQVAFEFDDSTVSDRQSEFAEKQILLNSGVMHPWEFRVWYFGETPEQAKAMIADSGEVSDDVDLVTAEDFSNS